MEEKSQTEHGRQIRPGEERREQGEKEEDRERKGKRGPREQMAEIAGLQGNEKLGGGGKPKS